MAATAYLDHAASSPVRPEVIEAMTEVLASVPGNPTGSHRWAREARRRLDDARDVVAEVVGAEPGEVLFTSGGTEADNLAVRGVIAARGGIAACSAVEHPAVLETVGATGGVVLPVDRAGRIDLDRLDEGCQAPGRPGDHPHDGSTPVSVVSVMLANNEVGTVNDLDAVAAAVAERFPEAAIHTDAVAAAAWIDLAKHAAPAALITVSAHKVGGPKGTGALVVRSGTPLSSVTTGGGQERERRSGTQDVAGAVGFSVALAAAAHHRDLESTRISGLRDRLAAALRQAVPDLVETVPPPGSWGARPVERTPGTLHLCVPGVDREALVFLLDHAGVGASWGSSCASGASEPSHVLAAMGVDADLCRGSLRLTLGWTTTDAEVDHAIDAIPAAIRQLRGPL